MTIVDLLDSIIVTAIYLMITDPKEGINLIINESLTTIIKEETKTWIMNPTF